MKNLSKILVVVILLTTLLTCLAGLNLNASAADTITIYFENNWLWTDVCVYYWGSSGNSWPGTKLSPVDKCGTNDVYAFTVPAGTTGVIFNGIKNDGSGNRDQTPDIKSFNDGDAWKMQWNNGNKVVKSTYVPPAPECDHANLKYSNGQKCTDSVTCPDCKESIHYDSHNFNNNHVCTRCSTPATFTVSGDGSHLGTAFDPTNTLNDMKFDASTNTYTKEYTDVKAGSYKFKCVRDHDGSWAIAYPGSDKTYTVQHDGSTVTMTLKGTTVTVTVTEGPCADGNDANHTCDKCGKEVTGESCFDATGDGDHKCDECGTVMTDAQCSGGTATCTDKAVCAECGAEYGEKDANNHTAGTTNGGTENAHTVYVCCGAVASAEHSYTSSVTAPTCTADGYTTYTCDCGYSYTGNVVPATGHSHTVTLSTTPATCTSTGSKTLKCEHCDSTEDKVIPVDNTAHKWVAGETVLPTCSAQGYTNYTCEHDAAHTKRDNYTEINSEAHAWNEGVVTTPADCENTGVKTYTCTHNAAHTREEEIPALNHIYDNDHDLDCNREGCNHTRACTHNGTEREVIPGYAATCTANGLTDGERCKNCGETTVAQQVIESTGHNHVGVVTDPTCTEGGYTTFTCSKCGDIYTGDVTAKLGHTEEVVEGKDATCTETGLTDGKKCTVCGVTTVEQTTIPAKGHTEETLDRVEADCVNTGLTAGKKCTVCGTVTVPQEVIPAKGHTPVVDKEVPPTCTTDGKTEGSHCGVCGDTIVAQQIIPGGHKLVDVDKKDATCTEAGYTAHKACEKCDYTEGKETIPAGHKYVNGECTVCDFVQMYFINSNGWNKVCAYTWTEGGAANATWPGVAISKTGEKVHGYDVYVVEVDSSKHNMIIFNNGNNGQQTPNLTLHAGQYFYCIKNQWYTNTNDVPEVYITNYTLAGSFTQWADGAVPFLLESKDGKVSYVSVELGANQPYEFKIVIDGKWYGCDATITGTVEDYIFYNNVENNAKLTTKCAGTYVFALEIVDGNVQLDITYPEHNYATKGNTVAPTFDAKGYTVYSCSCGETEKRDYVDALVAVAQIGEQRYETLQDAVAAAQNGDVIVLVTDVVLEDSLVIPANKTVVLDLAGYTVSQSKECTSHYAMIDNRGSLTIKGNGKISFTDTSAGDPSFGWGSYTIANYGTLVVENGTVEHLGAQAFATHMICAIWQYSGSTTINDGVFSTPNYRSIRLWGGEMTINGGTFDGQLWVQTVPNTAAKLTINGGTFGPNGRDGSSVFVTNDKHDVALSITGGNFITKIGATIPSGVAGAITGGTFATDVSAFVAEGYHLYKGTVSKHSYDDGVITTPAGCETEGVKTFTCECGHTYTEKVEPTGHSWNDGVVTTQPGCTTAGEKTYACSCGATKTEEVKATDHSYEAAVTAPTCTEGGYTTYTCSKCNDTYTGDVTDATNHPNKTTTTVDATCTTEGSTTVTCDDCHETLSTTVIPTTDHSYNAVVTAPTCKDEGYTTYTCACGESYTSDRTPATGAHAGGTATCQKLAECDSCGTPYGELGTHSYDAEGFDATCNVPGCDHVRTCAHDGDKVVIPGTDATCTTPGYTAGEKCAICGEVTVARQETGLADHTWGDWTVTTAPNCTTAGEERRDCEKCDAYETRRVEKLGHKYESVVTAPTCTSQGYTTHTCKNEGCGNSYVDSFLDKLDHVYTSEVTTAPTCTEKGVKTFTCECGKSYTEEIAATGHSYGEGVVTAPTCTAEGYTTYTCACGDSYKDSYTDKVAHADNDNDHMCDGCGEVKLSEHAYENGVCVICGAEKGHEHSYVDGKCECGAEDPDYVPDDNQGEGNEGGNGDDVTPPAEEPGYAERIIAKIASLLTKIGVPENITGVIVEALAKVVAFLAGILGKIKA